MSRLQTIALQIFLLSIPFTGIKLGGYVYANLTNIGFFFLFISNLSSLSAFFKIKIIQQIFIPYIILWSISMFNTWFNDYPGAETSFSFVRQAIMYLFSFVIVTGSLLLYPNNRNRMVHTYLVGLGLISLFAALGIGVGESDRLRLFGYSVAQTSLQLFIGFVLLFEIIRGRRNMLWKPIIYWGLCLFFGYALIRGATRSFLILLFLYPIFYLGLSRYSLNDKFLYAFRGALILTVIVFYLFSNSLVRERFMEIEEENKSGQAVGERLPIWIFGWKYSQDHIFFGGGASGWEHFTMVENAGKRHLGARTGIHNGYLQILIYGGLISLVCYFMILIQIYKRAQITLRFFGNPWLFVGFILLCIYTFIQSTFNSFTMWFFYSLIISYSYDHLLGSHKSSNQLTKEIP